MVIEGPATGLEGNGAAAAATNDREFQIDMLRLQMTHGYRVAYHAAYFGVGASFEVFSLNLFLTAILLGRSIDPLWWVLIALYLATGVGFVAYGVYGFGKTRRFQDEGVQALMRKYVRSTRTKRL